MNKKLFLTELRRLLSDIPQEEREQAIAYYEDYFEDAGPENEQKIIQELGSPLELAKQIKMTNQDNIEYGQGNAYYGQQSYPGVYSQNANNNGYHKNTGKANGFNQNTGYNNGYNQNMNGYANGYYNANAGGYNGQPKKSWTDNPSKVVLVVILALLAVPVGIPVASAIFGLIIAAFSVVFSLVIAFFALGGSLFIAGIVTFFGSFFFIASGGIAPFIFALGIGLILFAIGALILWVGITFCAKFLPAFCKAIGKCFNEIIAKTKKFFQ